jgi:hypothetical protein
MPRKGSKQAALRAATFRYEGAGAARRENNK